MVTPMSTHSPAAPRLRPRLLSRLRPCLAAAAAATLLPLLGACDPGGVTLGDDWSGSQLFVLAKVDGLTTVVGINPVARHAEPLAVIPSRSDDDAVVSPGITRLSDGRWLVTIPRTKGAPSTVYAVDTQSHGLTGVGTLSNGHTLLAAGGSALGLAGTTGSGAGKGQALLLDPASWRQQSARTLPLAATLAAGGAHGACIAQVGTADTQVAVLDPARAGTVGAITTLKGVQAQALDCAAGHPTVAARAAGASTGKPTVTVTHQGAVTLVTASGGDIARVADTAQGILAAVVVPQGVELIRMSADGTRELGRVSIGSLTGVDGMAAAGSTEVLTHDTTVATVDLTDSTVRSFSLPGTLLDAS